MLVRHGLTALVVSLCAVVPVAAHAQGLGVSEPDARPAALRCPGRALPKPSDQWLFDETWVTFNASDVDLQTPVGVAIDSHCNVYVADSARARILKLDQRGELVDMRGDASDFPQLASIAVDPNDNLYVADVGTRRVTKLDTDGGVRMVWAASCSGITSACVAVPNTTFENLALATDGVGRLYILANAELLQVSGEGAVLARWTTNGGATLKSPSAVGIDAAGDIFVADTGSGRVQKVSPQGELLRSITTQASRPEQGSSAPRGLAIDQRGNLLIAAEALAIDGQGNRFLADPARGRVVAALNVAVPTQSTAADDSVS